MENNKLTKWMRDNNPYPQPITSGDPYHGTESTGYSEWNRGILDFVEMIGIEHINALIQPTKEQLNLSRILQDKFRQYKDELHHNGGEQLEEYDFIKKFWNTQDAELPTQEEYEKTKRLQTEYNKYTFFCKQFNTDAMDEHKFISQNWNENLNTPDIGTTDI